MKTKVVFRRREGEAVALFPNVNQVFSICYELLDGTQYDGLLFSTRPKAWAYIGSLDGTALKTAGVVEVSIIAKEVL